SGEDSPGQGVVQEALLRGGYPSLEEGEEGPRGRRTDAFHRPESQGVRLVLPPRYGELGAVDRELHVPDRAFVRRECRLRLPAAFLEPPFPDVLSMSREE